MMDFVLNKDLAGLRKKFGFERIYCVDLIELKDADDLKRKTSKDDGLVVVRANNAVLRGIFENKRVDIVLGLESIEERDDLHYRKSGLARNLSGIAHKTVIVDRFSFVFIWIPRAQ